MPVGWSSLSTPRPSGSRGPLSRRGAGRSPSTTSGRMIRSSGPTAPPSPTRSCPWPCALRGETVTQEELVWRVRGETRTVAINAVPLTNVAGTIVGAVAVVQDVTPRKRAEVLLRSQNDFARAITETLGEGLCTIDGEGRVTFANPAALADVRLGRGRADRQEPPRDRPLPASRGHPLSRRGVPEAGGAAHGRDRPRRRRVLPQGRFAVLRRVHRVADRHRRPGYGRRRGLPRHHRGRKQLEARLAASERSSATSPRSCP